MFIFTLQAEYTFYGLSVLCVFKVVIFCQRGPVQLIEFGFKDVALFQRLNTPSIRYLCKVKSAHYLAQDRG